jgi:hypothetical protein
LSSPFWEGEAPAEPKSSKWTRLGRSLALTGAATDLKFVIFNLQFEIRMRECDVALVIADFRVETAAIRS